MKYEKFIEKIFSEGDKEIKKLLQEINKDLEQFIDNDGDPSFIIGDEDIFLKTASKVQLIKDKQEFLRKIKTFR